jgi:hypothetical protein
MRDATKAELLANESVMRPTQESRLPSALSMWRAQDIGSEA